MLLRYPLAARRSAASIIDALSLTANPAWWTRGPFPVVSAMSWQVCFRLSQAAQSSGFVPSVSVTSVQPNPSPLTYQS